jgi:hypothetical protein
MNDKGIHATTVLWTAMFHQSLNHSLGVDSKNVSKWHTSSYFRKGHSHPCIYYLRHGSVEDVGFTPTEWNRAKNAAYASWIPAPLEGVGHCFEVRRGLGLSTCSESQEAELKAAIALAEKAWRDCAKPRITWQKIAIRIWISDIYRQYPNWKLNHVICIYKIIALSLLLTSYICLRVSDRQN